MPRPYEAGRQHEPNAEKYKDYPVLGGHWKEEWGDPSAQLGSDLEAWDGSVYKKRIVEDAANEVAIRMDENKETAKEAFAYLTEYGDLSFGTVANAVFDVTTFHEADVIRLARELTRD
ncbi:hypothetical protein KKC60_04140 [Patescibacteria group bacterium]|nr:hypothetical protein [Patescibacteria group bacterium]